MNVKSNRFINVAGADHGNGAQIHQWDNPAAAETKFRIKRHGDAFTIQAVHSNKYINVAGGSADNGAKIHQWDNPGSVETQWRISKVGGTHKFKSPFHRYTIENNKARGKFLNVHGASYDNGAKLVLWDNPQMPETQWHIKKLGGGRYNIINVKSKKCINVAGAGHNNGALIHQWDNPNSPETQFKIHAVGGDALVIQAAHSGSFLNVAGGSTDNGAKIHQWNNPLSVETQWRIRMVPSSQFEIAGAKYAIQNNKVRGKFLNVHGASYDNGAKLVLWDNPQMPETQWHIK